MGRNKSKATECVKTTITEGLKRRMSAIIDAEWSEYESDAHFIQRAIAELVEYHEAHPVKLEEKKEKK